MEAEDSSPGSYEPAIEYQPYPVQPSPQLHTLFLQDPFQYYHVLVTRYVFQLITGFTWRL